MIPVCLYATALGRTECFIVLGTPTLAIEKGTVHDEWLGQYIFETIQEAQDQATDWLWTYKNERPDMGIGGMTPAMKLKTAA